MGMTEPQTDAGRRLLDAGAPEYKPNPCKHRGGSTFDRSICACGSMHDYCDDCHRAIGCPLNSPERHAERRREAVEPIVAIEREARTAALVALREQVAGLTAYDYFAVDEEGLNEEVPTVELAAVIAPPPRRPRQRRRGGGAMTKAGAALLAELEENPLAGARYARDVVGRRLAAIEEEAAKSWRDQYETMTLLARELLTAAPHGRYGGVPMTADQPQEREALARLLHDVTCGTHWSDSQITEGHWLGHQEDARRLIAAGVTLVPRPAPVDGELAKLREALDGAYRERNAVVAAFIRLGGFPAQIVMAPDTEGWWIVYAETPAGQVSWHVSPDDMDLFSDWPAAFGTARPPWDGHTTEEKYRRVASLAATPAAPAAPLDVDVLAAAERVLEWADAMQCKWCLRWAGSLFSAHEEGCPVGALRAALRARDGAGR